MEGLRRARAVSPGPDESGWLPLPSLEGFGLLHLQVSGTCTRCMDEGEAMGLFTGAAHVKVCPVLTPLHLAPLTWKVTRRNSWGMLVHLRLMLHLGDNLVS